MFLKVHDLIVYGRLCDLHLEICVLTRSWPVEEKFELAGQVRRSSSSSPAFLAERHDDRHAKNRVEGVNGSRREANETIHHLYIALRKEYIEQEVFDRLRDRYEECIRMLNGLERTYERELPPGERRWRSQDPPGRPDLTPGARTDLPPEP